MLHPSLMTFLVNSSSRFYCLVLFVNNIICVDVFNRNQTSKHPINWHVWQHLLPRVSNANALLIYIIICFKQTCQHMFSVFQSMSLEKACRQLRICVSVGPQAVFPQALSIFMIWVLCPDMLTNHHVDDERTMSLKKLSDNIHHNDFKRVRN